MKLTPLEIFNEHLNDVSILNETSFFELYPCYYNDASELLKKEIIINLNNLPDNKFNSYLKCVKEQIQENHVFDPSESIIQKWLTKFNLNESEFPFLFNEKVVQLITPNHTAVSLGKKDSKFIYSIQREFHLQAVKLEAIKMIAFIDDFLFENPVAKTTSDVSQDEDYYPKIFKDRNAFRLFKSLMEEFGNTKENLANYSFIFHKMTYEGSIHSDLQQQSYFDFLQIFDITIDRIKSLDGMGKKAYRESIYKKVKGN